MSNEIIYFTAKDLLCESILYLVNTGRLFGSIHIISSGILYNIAKRTKNPNKISNAYHSLHPELQLFKHNFLGRGKGHW